MNKLPEWLGKRPIIWKLTRLKYLVRINTGSKDTQDKKVNGKYNFYVRSQKIEKIDVYTNEGEAILTAGDGVGVGKVFHYVDGKYSVHQRVYIFNQFKAVLGKFLYYYLKSNLGNEVLNGNAKSTVDSLRKPLLNDFIVIYPDLSIQKMIVKYIDSKLSEIDALISFKEKQIKLLEEQRQAMVTEAVTKGLNPNVKMKYSGVEWIGEIPEHWEISKIKNKFTINKRVNCIDNPVVFSMTQRGIKEKNIEDYSGQHAESYSKYQQVLKNDFVMNGMDLLTGYIDISNYEYGVTSPDYRVFTLNNSKDLAEYFLMYFQMCYKQKIFYGLGQGVSKLGRWRLQTKTFKNFPIMVPPKEEQIEIIETIKCSNDDIVLGIDLIQIQISKMKEYRQSLIHEAVTGKIPIEEMRSYLKEAEKDDD